MADRDAIIFPVEAGHIMLFARAVGDPNPVYSDAQKAAQSEAKGIVAPPTFVQSSAQYTPGYPLRPVIGKPWFGSGKTPSGLTAAEQTATGETAAEQPQAEEPSQQSDKSDSGGGSAGTLHAEQHFTYHRHPRPGDVLTATSRPGQSWEKQSKRAGKLMFSEMVTEYRSQDGELVITARMVGVRTEKIIQQ